jgi:hypothetical protein
MTISPIHRVRLDKAAVDEGFGIRRDVVDGWLLYTSIDAPGAIRLTHDGAVFMVATDHTGVVSELSATHPAIAATPAAGFTAFAATNTTELHHLVREIWRLSRALPSEPFREFELQTQGMPRATEAQREAIVRVGQNIFRAALFDYWGGGCAVLGVREPAILRASHIHPWRDCTSDAERLDVFNGLLLSAHLDAAFDAFLISFDDTGRIVISNALSNQDLLALGLHIDLKLRKVAPAHIPRLKEHRSRLRMV